MNRSSQSTPSGSPSRSQIGTPLRGTPPGGVPGTPSRSSSGSTERRRSPSTTLTLMPQSESSIWDFTDGVPPITMEGWAVYTGLPPDEMAAFQASATDFLKQLTQLSEADKAQIPAPQPAPPTTSHDRSMAVLFGGMAAYGTSFLFGKLAQSYLSAMVHPAAGGAAFVVIAGLLNAAASEAAAGGVRANWGSYASPDGTAVANYTTVLARRDIALAEGDCATVKRCDEAVKKIVDDLIARVDKARADGHPIFVNIPSMPVFSAWLRSFLSDELPFYSFSLMYLFSGAAMPYQRAALIGPTMAQKASFATLEFFTSFLCGMLGGMGTVLGQHLLRPPVQRVAEPTAGLHTTWQDDAARSYRAAQLYGLHLGKAQQIRQSILDAARAHPNPAAALDASTEVLKRVDKTIEGITKKMIKLLKRVEKLREREGRNKLQIQRNLHVNLKGGVGKTALPLIEGGGLVRRQVAKGLGNVLALAPFGYYLYHLASLAEQVLPSEQPPGFPGNGTLGMAMIDPIATANHTVVAAVALQQGIQSLVAPAMASGTVLITSWIVRTPLHHLIERGMGMAVALSSDPLYWWRTPAPGGQGQPQPPAQPDDTLTPDGAKVAQPGLPRSTTVVDLQRVLNTPPGGTAESMDPLGDALEDAMGELSRLQADESGLEIDRLLAYLDRVVSAGDVQVEVVDSDEDISEQSDDWGSPTSPTFQRRVRDDLVRRDSANDSMEGIGLSPRKHDPITDTDSSSEAQDGDDESGVVPLSASPTGPRHASRWGQTMLTQVLLTGLIEDIEQMERQNPDVTDQ